MRCTHCGDANYKKDGKTNGLQKYKCHSCNKSFSDKVRKFTYEDKERFLDMYLNNVGVRKSARFMGCSSSLIVRWVSQFADALKRRLDKAKDGLNDNVPDVIEMDEIYTRVKKGGTGYRYGLLILDDEVRLLRLPLGVKAGER